MKLASTILLFGLSTALWAAEPPPASTHEAVVSSDGPRIQFEQTRVNFGLVDPQVLKTTFKFRNIGDKTLEVTNVQPGCGCTVIPDYDRQVEPGKEGVIHVELSVTPTALHIEKSITVTSNDPKTPAVNLALEADIKLDILTVPQNVFFDGLRTNGQARMTLQIRSMLAQPLVVEKIESSMPWLTVNMVSHTTNSATIEVSTKPPLPDGMTAGKIVVFTTYEKHKRIEIDAALNVPGIISVFPQRLAFSRLDAKTGDQRTLLARRNDAKEFRITGIHSSTPLLSGEIRTNTPGKVYFVVVKCAPRAGDPTREGKLEILTDEPAFPKLEVPVLLQ